MTYCERCFCVPEVIYITRLGDYCGQCYPKYCKLVRRTLAEFFDNKENGGKAEV